MPVFLSWSVWAHYLILCVSAKASARQTLLKFQEWIDKGSLFYSETMERFFHFGDQIFDFVSQICKDLARIIGCL